MNNNLFHITNSYLEFYKNKSFNPTKPLDLISLSIEDSYLIQKEILNARVLQGETIVGYKVGCTSESIRKQFGLEKPI